MSDQAVLAVRNLGPKMAEWLGAIGISSRADLEEIGAVEAWIRLRASRPGVSLIALYAMQAGLMDIDWRELPDAFKAALREQAGL